MRFTEFLLAQIAKDEADARVELERFIRDHGPAELVDTTWAHPYMDPRRVLAECERDRRIVELHVYLGGHESRDFGFPDGNCWECRKQGPCPTLRTLATIYADRPDYREEWKP